jgi:hypothetical protein
MLWISRGVFIVAAGYFATVAAGEDQKSEIRATGCDINFEHRLSDASATGNRITGETLD